MLEQITVLNCWINAKTAKIKELAGAHAGIEAIAGRGKIGLLVAIESAGTQGDPGKLMVGVHYGP